MSTAKCGTVDGCWCFQTSGSRMSGKSSPLSIQRKLTQNAVLQDSLEDLYGARTMATISATKCFCMFTPLILESTASMFCFPGKIFMLRSSFFSFVCTPTFNSCHCARPCHLRGFPRRDVGQETTLWLEAERWRVWCTHRPKWDKALAVASDTEGPSDDIQVQAGDAPLGHTRGGGGPPPSRDN